MGAQSAYVIAEDKLGGAYAEKKIMAQPWRFGALTRSLHRYSSNAAILAAVLHACKMFLNDRFWGARWIGWVSGLGLLALVWITSATGYWLVWDVVAGCVPEDCPYREGSLWLAERLGGARLPVAKDLPAERLRVRWYAPVETARFVNDVRTFQQELPR